MSEVLDAIASRVLATARELAPGADVRVEVARSSSANVRFARNEPTTAGEGEERSVSLWIGLGRRHATASTNQVDAASVRRLAERAVAMARLSPEDPERVPLLPPQRYREVPSAHDEALAKMGAGDRAALAGRAIAEGDRAGVHLAGFFQRSAVERVLRSSTGLSAHHRETAAQYTVTARTPDGKGSGWAGREVHRAADLDDAALVRTAIDKGVRSAGARALPPGKYTVVLEPAAVMELLAFVVAAMDARSADEGRSFFAGKLGQKLFAEGVSLRSDPSDPRTPGAPFDGEGMPLEPRTWIDRGRVSALAVSRFWAAKKGLAPTGQHGVFRLDGGEAESVDALVRGTERGLLVTRFWYNRMLEPQTLLVTGLTRDGLFAIENGRITGPVTNFRYNESPVTVLRNVDALTRATVRVPGWGGAWHVPALRTHEFTMASPSDAV